MKYKLLLHEFYRLIPTTSKPVHACLGIGGNVNAVKYLDGVLYFQLSPIADPNLNYHTGHIVSQRFNDEMVTLLGL